MAAEVDSIRSEVAEMQASSAVCQILDGGTDAMRAAGRTYLPQWPQEVDKSWESRRDSSFLFPAYAKTLDTMVGKPLGEPVIVKTSTTIESHLENVDMAGRDLDTFCRDIFREALKTGITWVLVDSPRMDQPAPNLAAEQAAGVRPYWVHIPLSRILGWRTTSVGGKTVVTQVRILESVEVDDGAWGTAYEKRVRVLMPGWVQVYRKQENQWVLLNEGPVSLQEIPLVPIYTGRTGFWTATPPLKDLAQKNVEHWQSASDQRNILHVARVPFLAADSDDRQDTEGKVTLTPNGIITGFPGLRFVEHSGAAIGAGREDLVDLENQMMRMAGEMLSRVPGDKSATESQLEAGEGASWLKAKVRTFQDALEECLRLHGAWIGDKTPPTVTVNTEWDEVQLTAQMIQALGGLRASGNLSREAMAYNLSEGGFFPEGWTTDDELNALDSEGPAAMTPILPFAKMPKGMPPGNPAV